jgi:hypothetical protein
MSGIVVTRIAVAVAGMVVWAYGAREDHPTARWIGIGLIAVSLLLRFVGPRPSRGGHDEESADL